MAATINEATDYAAIPRIVRRLKLSTLTSDLTENIAHGGPSGAKPSSVRMEVITRPTDGSPVFMQHASASDSLTGNTINVRFYTVAGGSLVGAVVQLDVEFNAVASGGITAT